jgi:CheY-like chemotaxis protein
VVDDLPINQLVAQKTIAKTGDHHIEHAGNGVEAVEEWSQGDYDIIFMDVQMPVMDGLEATTEIRARERRTGGHIPVIATTAHATSEDRDLCMRAGMDDFLTKPIRPAELFAAIERHQGPAP